MHKILFLLNLVIASIKSSFNLPPGFERDADGRVFPMTSYTPLVDVKLQRIAEPKHDAQFEK